MTNPGHYHGYNNFSIKQILSLKRLLKYLMKKYKIGYKCILGHSDISPDRKKDPGEKFPWYLLAKNKLAWWHKLDLKKLKSIERLNFIPKKKKVIF